MELSVLRESLILHNYINTIVLHATKEKSRPDFCESVDGSIDRSTKIARGPNLIRYFKEGVPEEMIFKQGSEE